MGRLSKFTQGLAAEICERLAKGETLRSICRSDGMPDERTVRQWDEENRDGFSPHYARARVTGYHAIAEECLEIADDGSNDWIDRHKPDGEVERVLDHEHVTRSKLRLEQRRWHLSKMLPKIYGDRTEIEHTGQVGVISAVPMTVDEWETTYSEDDLGTSAGTPKGPDRLPSR